MSDTELLLLSGGVDSVAIAALVRPALTLFVDYGQVVADGERAAANFAATSLSLPFKEIAIDLASLGSGLLVNGTQPDSIASSPEWFPYRNQFLLTIASAVALAEGHRRVLIGTVADDGTRHTDGTTEFLSRIASLIAMQEGHIEITAPFANETASTLLSSAGLPDELLLRTFSCHVSSLPCGRCPGCQKRARQLQTL